MASSIWPKSIAHSQMFAYMSSCHTAISLSAAAAAAAACYQPLQPAAAAPDFDQHSHNNYLTLLRTKAHVHILIKQLLE